MFTPKVSKRSDKKSKMASLNTHSYDSHLKHFHKKFEKDMKSVSWLQENVLSFEKSIEEAKIMCTEAKNVQALRTLQLFESKQGNHDTTSDLKVEIIFPLIWAAIRSLHQRMDEKDVLVTKNGFMEQLADVISMGSCAQGRVTRLLNYYSLIS